MSLIKISTKGSALSCSELDSNFDFVLDLANATGELDCAKINPTSLSTCLLANSVIQNIRTEIDVTQTAVGEVAQDLIDTQTSLQNNINALTSLINNQNITIADLNSQISTLITGFTNLSSTVNSFESRLVTIEGRVTTLETAIASGIIVVWSGLISAIPVSWALCNGQNGSPDLRDRFIIGAGATYALNAIGGSVSHTHTINGSTGLTALTVAQLPSHSHGVNDPGHQHMTQSPGYPEGNQGFQPGGAGGDVGTSPTLFAGTNISIAATGSNGGHNHTFSATTATTSNLPPYYALAYIMKI